MQLVVSRRKLPFVAKILEDHLYCQVSLAQGVPLTEGTLCLGELLAVTVISLLKTHPQVLSGIFTRPPPPKHLDIEAEDMVCSGKAKSWVMEEAVICKMRL